MKPQPSVDMTPIFIPVFKLLIPVLIAVLLFAYIKVQIENWFYRRSGMSDVDKMSGYEFERFLQAHFEGRGYKVQLTPYQGDFGADIVMAKDGERIAVQVKRHKKNVGIKAVQEVVASVAKYGCHRSMVITNSTFTKAARELAKSNKVELWDRDRLQREVSSKTA